MTMKLEAFCTMSKKEWAGGKPVCLTTDCPFNICDKQNEGKEFFVPYVTSDFSGQCKRYRTRDNPKRFAELVEKLKVYYGLPPHDVSYNTSRGDNFFIANIERNYTKDELVRAHRQIGKPYYNV